MSIIPKIGIGVDTHKGKFNLSAMTHTTSEIGYVQPTYSKLLVPNSRLDLQTRTGSRLSPLFVPTMGQIDIRHYHCFVPLSTIWTPFDAFLTKTNYTLPSGSTYIPTKCPYFTVYELFRLIFGWNQEYVRKDGSNPLNLYRYLSCCIYSTTDGHCLTDAELNQPNNDSWTAFFSNLYELGYMPGYVKSDEGTIWALHCNYNQQSSSYMIFANKVQAGSLTGFDDIDEDALNFSYPTLEACDFSCKTTGMTSGPSNNAMVCFNFNGMLKRLRTIFMGLGYSFNPYDKQKVTPFKLLAFYKSYWSLFGVNRYYNFFNTYCYKLIKILSDSTRLDCLGTSDVSVPFCKMMAEELGECTYTCPADYFTASDTTTQRASENVGNIGFNFGSDQTNGSVNPVKVGANTAQGAPVYATQNDVVGTTPASNPLAQIIAKRLLRFINKNSVIGRKVSDLLRARYGVSDDHNYEHEGVHKIGASATPINIGAIFNQTDGETMPLGSYAGLGASGKDGAISKKFFCETKEFGIFITLTSVVPKMGYFQGMLRENSDGVNDNMEFYTPEFDAIGWQSVRYNELVADRQFWGNNILSDWSSQLGTQLGVFGYMPTYSHLKVPFNRCLGDISIPHMQDSMLCYTLDRFFPQWSRYNYTGYVPDLPRNNANWMRAGTRGQTNRIFTDVSPTDDHVIMQIYFDIRMFAPMKPLTTSFDTIDEESTHTIEVEHE